MVTIVKTDIGFIPSNITISPGDAVQFVNTSNQPMWPASDAHPSHNILPTFDSKRSLQPGESWEYTFTESGSWHYHDHTNPTAGGVIIVTGADRLGNNCMEAVTQLRCWVTLVENAYLQNGLGAALEIHSDLLKTAEGYPGKCHDVLHTIGEQAYQEYLSDESVAGLAVTADCAFGFHHGLIESIIREEGSYSGTRAYCAIFTDIHGNLNSCHHGVGHALFDSIGYGETPDTISMVETASQQCVDIFTDTQAQAECIDGVGNGFIFAASNPDNPISFNKTNPFIVCLGLDTRISFYCYEQIAFSRTSDFNEFTKYVSLLEPSLQERLFYSHMKAHVAWRVPDEPYAQFMSMKKCLTLDTPENVTGCMGGVHHGVAVKEEAIFDTFKVNPDRITVSNHICNMFATAETVKLCRESVRYLEDNAERFL